MLFFIIRKEARKYVVIFSGPGKVQACGVKDLAVEPSSHGHSDKKEKIHGVSTRVLTQSRILFLSDLIHS